MGKITLARIDDRLIHGQVMTRWSKGLGTNALYVIDNETAKDDFMKMIYINTNSSSGLTIKVYSEDEVIEQWNKDEFGKDNAILLFKTIATVQNVLDKGLPFAKLNIGGIAKTNDAKFIISSVGLSNDGAEKLRMIAEKGIDVSFQTVPDSKKVTLADALKML